MIENEMEPAARNKMKASFNVYCQSALKKAAERAADKAGLPLSEFAAKAIAEYLGKPNLGDVPRKKLGRRRVEQTA